jgi:hypothetical protein
MRRLGARTGISAGLVFLIALVVLLARLAGNDDTSTPYSGPGVTPSMATSVGDDAQVAPTPSAYLDNDEVRDAASAFTAAWLQRSLTPVEWHKALVPLSTDQLAASLEGVDPLVVPATRVVGEVTITLRSELYSQVSIPVDSGVVELGLLKGNSGWRVDSVDWQRT